MARSARVAVTAALLLALLVAAPAPAEGAVTNCGQVVGFLAPCLGYAMGRVASPAENCCNGVKSLKEAAASTADRKMTCTCLKQQTSSMAGIKPDLIAGIPNKCGVKIPYSISASTDCSKVR